MALCDDIRLLLSPFEDGELEPHEMQEVARHVVGCPDCEAELADYRSLAVSLRGAATIPDLDGFRDAVLARVEELPVPFRIRLSRYLTSFTDGIGATLASGLAAAAVAVVTAVILTPYVKQIPLLMGPNAAVKVANRDRLPQPAAPSGSAAASPAAPRQLATSDRPADLAADVADGVSGGAHESGIAPVMSPVDESGDSGAIISHLEADSPSVAIWSEPQSDTTVIWVPDQPR